MALPVRLDFHAGSASTSTTFSRLFVPSVQKSKFTRARCVVVHTMPRPSIHAGDHPMNLFVDFDVLNEHFGARRRPEASARATVASSESMFLAVEPVL